MFTKFPPIYMVPPILSFIVGITLAIVSIAKGKLKSENILFSLICIWWSLMPPVFISHHLLTSEEKIIFFERLIHFFYVYLPVIHLLFIHKILNIKRRSIIISSIILSFLISLSTFTDYYIQGLYEYSWGYIAKGGIAFQIFGAYGFLVIFYLLYCLFDNLKRETDSVKRLSNSYMILSFIILGVLILSNLPAINGIDLYPAGNFIFIPLGFLAYGVLRYRMLDIKSFLHISVVRIFSLIIFLLPNWAIFYYTRPYFSKMDNVPLFALFALWFFANYLYLTRVQTKLDDKFYRMKYKLKLSEIEFSDNIRFVGSYKTLIEKVRLTLRDALELNSVTVFQRIDKGSSLVGPLGYQLDVDTGIEKLLFDDNHFIDRKTIETNPRFTSVSEKIVKAFSLLKSSYMIPLYKDEKLLALFFLKGSSYVKISKDEINFANNVLKSASGKLSELEVFDSKK